MSNDFDIAVSRMTHWLGEYSDSKPKAFVGDVTLLLAAAKHARQLEAKLAEVTDLVDDILYDPQFHPVDKDGNEIRGNDLYRLDHPVRDRHMPDLREWFVKRYPENEQ